jgi:hypothetical protein
MHFLGYGGWIMDYDPLDSAFIFVNITPIISKFLVYAIRFIVLGVSTISILTPTDSGE